MKRYISLLLVFVLAVSVIPYASAFKDITDFSESAAAESLASLGIIDNVDNFNPNDCLTRSQFCKIAVLAAGFTETSLYSGYTIYPDVASNTWYAPYVNAAVRKYAIIKGDEKGNFNPESNITYGEAVTIMLRMLGYTTADIGMMWPADYVNKAQSMGLSSGMRTHAAANAITRGQAAILLCNMLLSTNKAGTVFAATGFSTGSAESILLSTSQTNPNLSSNQAVLYLDDKSTTYATTGTISPTLCGLKGIPVFSSTSQSRIRGFIADIGGAEIEEVTSVSSSALTVGTGKINVPRDTLTMAGGSVGTYITCWFDIKAGDKITLYYDDSGELELISTLNSAVSYNKTYIYGADTASFPSNATYIKNGIKISASDLSNYDVISYSQTNNTYYVSSDRVTLLYQSGSPVYSNPSVIKAGNKTFSVSEKAGSYFNQSGIKVGGKITLLLDYSGNLAAVMPASKVTAKAIGVLSSLSDSSCTINLACGLTLTGTPSTSGYTIMSYNGQHVSSLYKLQGQLVETSQNSDGLFTFNTVALSGGTSGDLDLSKRVLGKKSLAQNIRIYECSARGMALHEISLEDLPAATVDSSKVLHSETDTQGNINMVVLEDVTGDRFIYGMIKLTSEKVQTDDSLDGSTNYQTQYSFTVKTASNIYSYTTVYKPTEMTTINPEYIPGAISTDLVGDNARSYNFVTPAFKLSKAATVTRDSFDAYRGVKINGKYVPVEKDVVIYSSSGKTFLSSLSEARANFTSFSIYLDRPVSEGGTVRVITVQ
ncbi:MAG: S-layer homology domain-containing protein [Clostridiaceae bacterium]|nr:S-layer homology domain-containing protein [Clostridiaceae bacterium]